MKIKHLCFLKSNRIWNYIYILGTQNILKWYTKIGQYQNIPFHWTNRNGSGTIVITLFKKKNLSKKFCQNTPFWHPNLKKKKNLNWSQTLSDSLSLYFLSLSNPQLSLRLLPSLISLSNFLNIMESLYI